MKKIFKMMMAVVAGFAALTACTNEPEEGVTPTPEAQGFTVIASMDDATKATMSDEAGMAWEVGDQIAVRQYTLGGGSHEAVSNGLAAENIAADGKASFTFGHLLNDNPAYFFYNLNGNAVWKSEFNFNPTMTQESAGVMNKSYLKLRSKEGVEITTTGTNTIETEMNIVGTLARFIIYSSNEEYIGEKVESVNMVSTTTNISGLIAYNNPRNRYWHENGDGIDAGVQGEECKIFWNHGKNIMVSLTNPMEVNTRDAESSQGKTVYMPIPPVKVEGYKYIVTTDKATYTFDATDKTTQFNENELKNIKLNLENATKRAEIRDDFKGYVYYEGGPGNATINADQTFLNSIGYTVARYSDTNGENWVYATENKGQHEWLYNATYKYYDMNGNEVAAEDSWVTMGFSENNICHWCVNTEVNTGVEQRQMKVVGQIVAPEGYKLAVWSDNLNEKEYRYEFIITQKANIVVTGELSNVYADTVPAAGETIEAATLTLNVNDVAATDIAAAMSTYGITVEAGSATATVDTNGKVTLVVPENKYNEVRTYDLVVKFDGNTVTSAKIYQAAGTEEMPYIYNYTFGAWSGAQGTEVTLNLSANGATNEWLAVFNSVTLKSGENLTVNDIDVNLFISQVFHSEQLEYDWISFNLEGPFNDYKLRCTLAPNTGARRTAVLYAYVSDGSDSWWRKITINQDPAPGM